MESASKAASTLNSFAAISLVLRPLERELLNAVGSYPLLMSTELAIVLQSAPSKVWDGVARLRQWELIEAHRYKLSSKRNKELHTTGIYTLSDRGLRLLAAIAGTGNAWKSVVQAHGWEEGFQALVAHREHTRISNEVFIQLLQYARTHGHSFTWYAEQEARLYIKEPGASWGGHYRLGRPCSRRRSSESSEDMASEYERDWEPAWNNRKQFEYQLATHGQHFHKFLPDGRGLYVADGETWHLPIELYLSRANYAKMRAELNYYYEFILTQEYPISIRILFITHCWRRAQNLYWLTWQVAAERAASGYYAEWDAIGKRGVELLRIVGKQGAEKLVRQVLPIYITTVEELRTKGIGEPIWLRAQEILTAKETVQHKFTRVDCLDGIG